MQVHKVTAQPSYHTEPKSIGWLLAFPSRIEPEKDSGLLCSSVTKTKFYNIDTRGDSGLKPDTIKAFSSSLMMASACWNKIKLTFRWRNHWPKVTPKSDHWPKKVKGVRECFRAIQHKEHYDTRINMADLQNVNLTKSQPKHKMTKRLKGSGWKF